MAPEIKTHLVKTKESRCTRENHTAGLYHAKNVAETKLKFAEVLESAGKQETIVGL